MKALVNLNLLHGAVEGAFPGPRKRKLWRIDKLVGRTYLLLLSEDEPDLLEASAQFGEAGWESKKYDNLLSKIEDGTQWRFRLVANPTISVKSKDGSRSVVKAHIALQYQKKWLLQRSFDAGFVLTEDSFTVVGKRWQRFYKGGESKRPVNFLAVTYEGVLLVVDAERFRHTLVEGLGREKAYGMGLLTVVQVV
jgi:CRISPR system Cascade subunit CasE